MTDVFGSPIPMPSLTLGNCLAATLIVVGVFCLYRAGAAGLVRWSAGKVRDFVRRSPVRWSAAAVTLFTVAAFVASPVNSDPPGPEPEPVVVDPTPPQPPAPFVTEGVNVLIVEETEERSELPLGQLAVISSSSVRNWCASRNVELRVLDQNAEVLEEGPWKAALALPHGDLPWVFVSTGTTGYSGPLPANVDEMLTLLGRFVQ